MQVIDVRAYEEPLDAAIAELAARQLGVFSRGQAIALGASRSMIEVRLATGRWQRMHPGVYRVGGAYESWYQSLMAASLAYENSAVSFRAADALWDFPGSRRDRPELSTP